MIHRMHERRIRHLTFCHECWHWDQKSTHQGRCMRLIILTEPSHYCGYALPIRHTTSQNR